MNPYKENFEKAKIACAEKKYAKEPVLFDEIQVSDAYEKMYWFLFRVVRKIKKELKK